MVSYLWDSKRAAIVAIVERVTARLAAGEPPLTESLSDNKGAGPTLLCLDTNKWIDLPRAHHGRRDGARFADALKAIRAAVSAGRVVVPVAGSNAHEAMGHENVERRRRLAEFMVDLSRNHSLVNHLEIGVAEMRAGLVRMHGKEPVDRIRPYILQRGMTAAVMGKKLLVKTGHADLDRLLEQAHAEPEISVAGLVHAVDRPTMADLKLADVEAHERIQRIRRNDAHMSIAERRAVEIPNLLRRGGAAEQLRSIFVELGLPPEPHIAWLLRLENVLRFADVVPWIDVMSTLMLNRDQRSQQHRGKPSDAADYSFLNVAIPYANIVVTERSWAHLAEVTGLAARYNTRVISDVAELPSLLA